MPDIEPVANVVQIRRGSTIPDDTKLEKYEMGYLTAAGGGRMYIRDENLDENLNGTKLLIRKIFVQSEQPDSNVTMEGDLWVNTSTLE